MSRSRHFVHGWLLAALLSALPYQAGCKTGCYPGTRPEGGACVSIHSKGSGPDEAAAAGAGAEAAGTGALTGTTTNGTQGAAAGGPSNTATIPQNGASQGGSAGQAGAGAQQPGNGNGTDPNDPNAAQNQGANGNSTATPDAGAAPNMSGDPAAGCTPVPEACDGQDNDCDMVVDESIEPMPCGLNRGICTLGTVSCRNGQWEDPATQCQGATAPGTEVCDAEGLDEDCNGIPNDGCDCSDGETMECGEGPFTCRKGTVTCQGGQWSACQGEEKGSAETCDGQDNDCDGTRDNGGDRLCTRSAPFCDGARGCVACQQDIDCPRQTNDCAASRCSSGSCSGDNLPDGTSCNSNGGRVCAAGVCVRCIRDSDCESGSTCTRSTCVAPPPPTAGYKACTTAAECQSPFVCQVANKLCTKQCSKESDCVPTGSPKGAACYQGLCFIDCGGDTECPSGAVCQRMFSQYPKENGEQTTGICRGR
jgi:hypothetical protein